MTSHAKDPEAIFLAALDMVAPDERAAYVETACAGDAELLGRVRKLLACHDATRGPLDVPPPGFGATIDLPQPNERPGTTIGPYKLLQQIGEGGMGTVFMAEQTQPVQRKVAVKVIKPGMDSRQVIARFEAERQALAMMDHVNIARVFDAGATEAGRPYFVMELVHGVPITRYCDDNHLTPRERLELFVPVCQAIQHAHQKGIIHRDVKPSNVMITLYDGKPVPKVIDFGVAKATEQKLTERTLFTQYGTMVGTLEYMSPEQAEMSALGVDTRSDIFSLGVLLYELLTGTTPLSHKRLKVAAYGEILRMIREEEPPRPSTRLSDSGEALVSISAQRHTEPAKLATLVRGELDWIVMKTLEKDRNRRYETASAFAADVQRYLNDEPVLACPPTAGYRFRKFARRNKRILATVGLLALALITGTVVSAWQAIRATEAEGLAQTRLQAETDAQNATRDQLRLTEQAEDLAKRRLYLLGDSLVDQARASRLSQRIGQRFKALEILAEATKRARDLNLPEEDLLKLRNEAIACLALSDLRLRQWPGGWPAGSDHVDFDGNLKHYARVDKQGAVTIRRVAGDNEIARLPGSGSESWPLFSRDGKFLAVFTSTTLTVWKLGGHEPVMVVSVPDSNWNGIDFSPDSRQCAVGHMDGSISLHDLASGQPPRRIPGDRRVAALAFHPEGRQLAVSRNTSVEIRDLDTGKVVAKPLHHLVTTHLLAWPPDGKTLAVVGSDSRIYLWDVAAGKQTVVIEGLMNHGIVIAFNHAGDLLASTGWEGKLRLWDPRTGQQLFSTPSGTPGAPPRFSHDDRLLSGDVRDGKLGLWEVAVSGEYRTLVRAPAVGKEDYHNPTIHSDGRLLAVGMYGGVGLWDLTSGKEQAFLNLPGSNLVLFEPSGALLTNGSAGLLRWPVRDEPGSPGLLRIGPPHKFSVPGATLQMACSRDGRVMASAQFQGGLVLHRDRPDQPVPFGPHGDARHVAVSPDGRLVASGSHNGTKVIIWQTQDGKLERELPVETGARVGFSPNGKWLATAWGELRLWAVGSWQEGPLIGGGGAFAFAPDAQLLAVASYGSVLLVDPDTGREYARLEDPHQDRAGYLSFSPDGTQLVATNGDSQSIHVWNLRAIREQLVKMDLDWDLPPYPRSTRDFKPLRVEVDRGDLAAMIQAQDSRRQGDGYLQSREWEKAIAAYSKAIELKPDLWEAFEGRRRAYAKLGQWDKIIDEYANAIQVKPDDAGFTNYLAWLLATCPDPKSRDPKRAVELGKKAVQLAPKDGNCWNTLGVAQYRANDWKAAVVALVKSNELLGGKELSFNAFFLAMAHWKLDQKEEARTWYDKAVAWMDKNKPQDEELRRFHAEVKEVLGLKDSSGSKK